MRSQERISARRHLDKRLNSLRSNDSFARPSRGWVKAIREALGMTTAQLGRRIGVSQPRAVAIEQAERANTITLGTLQRAAHALDCELVYALVPRKPLEEMAGERALALAGQRLAHTRHNMALEDQAVEVSDEQEQLKGLARQLLVKPGSALWDQE